MIVADTDVLIDFLRRREPWVTRIEQVLAPGHLATTAVTAFELRVGARDERQRAVVDTLLAATFVWPLDGGSARDAAAIRRDLQARGVDIGMADSLIAGICRANDGTLLTRNRRHFEWIDGLRLCAVE